VKSLRVLVGAGGQVVEDIATAERDDVQGAQFID
jgi:hypothetical protein